MKHTIITISPLSDDDDVPLEPYSSPTKCQHLELDCQVLVGPPSIAKASPSRPPTLLSKGKVGMFGTFIPWG